MNAEQWREVERLVHEALSLDPAGRAAFTRCIDDPRVRAEVESLLAVDARKESSGIDGIIGEAAGRCLPEHADQARQTFTVLSGNGPVEAPLPAAIGRYRILGLLGEGGMGAVYEAEQEQPRRKIALKVIKSAWAAPELLYRFELESQALGRLHHPGIAQIYEAGAAETGAGRQPFFAMELIQGKSLCEYAESEGLSTRERLGLMIRVCDAVQHAHRRGIIHRDLKPGNILVDESGQPKILDFGLARIIDSDAQATRQTDAGQLLGTLAYMSPEQVLADPLAIDTRSDVYALGVILYELLAGKLPYALTRHIHQAVETIRKDDPLPLSAVSRAYRGDIETIVNRALEKDRERRYASAADLAADLRRHLDDQPIAAKPPSAAYQLRKFAHRHKAVVTGVSAVLVVLVGGIVASTREASRARGAEQSARDAQRAATRQRDRAVAAEQQAQQDRNRARESEEQAVRERNAALQQQRRADTAAAIAAAVNEFLQKDLLAQASNAAQAGPGAKPDPNLTVRAALDRAAKRVDGKFENQPLVEASIRATIGRTYADLGVYPEAVRQFQRALELKRKIQGPESPDTIAAQAELARWLVQDSRDSAAEPLLASTLAAQRRFFGENDRRTLDSTSTLGSIYNRQGKYAQAEALLRSALDRSRRLLGHDDPVPLAMLSPLAFALAKQNRYQEAIDFEIDELAADRRVYGAEHPYTVGTMHNMAMFYGNWGQYAQAEELYRQVIEIQGRVRGVDHPNRLATMGNLADLYRRQGKFEDAEQLFLKVVEANRRVRGDEHPATLIALNNLATVYLDERKFTQAEPLLTKLVPIRRRVSGEDYADTLIAVSNLAVCYAQEDKYSLAEPLFAHVVEVRRRLLGPEHLLTLSSTWWLGHVYRLQGSLAQAEPLLTNLLDTERRVYGPQNADTLATMGELAELYSAQNRFAKAEPMMAMLAETRRRVLGPQHADTLGALSSLGLLRIQLHRYGDAEAVIRDVLAGREKTIPDDWRRYNSECMLGESLAGQARYAEAETLLLSGYEGLLKREGSIPSVSRYNLDNAETWILDLYQNWGKPAEAESWKRRIHGGSSRGEPAHRQNQHSSFNLWRSHSGAGLWPDDARLGEAGIVDDAATPRVAND